MSRRRSLAALAAVTALGALAVAGPATAYRQVAPSGSPGRVVVQQVVGSHWDPCNGTSQYVNGVHIPLHCWGVWLSGAAHVVGRSPLTSGTQRVTVAYRVLATRSAAAFAPVTSGSYSVFIPAGSGAVRLAAMNVLPAFGAGSYRVSFAIAWSTPSGRTLGTRAFAMMDDGDFACSTYFPCAVGGGAVALGRTMP